MIPSVSSNICLDLLAVPILSLPYAFGTIYFQEVPKPNDESLALAGNLSPTLTLPVGVNVSARTVTPYTSLSSQNSAIKSTETPLSVKLDQPIELTQGFNLPAGTVIQFAATVNDNGAVTAVSRGVFIDGTELKVPVGAFALTASNSSALVANQRALRDGELNGADNTAALWGAAGAVGKALSESGNTSVVNTSGFGGTSVVQTNSGQVNIPGAILNGAFSPLAKAKEARANALAQELQKSSKLNEIPVQSPVRVFVATAAAIQIPIASEATTTAGNPEQSQFPGGTEVEQPPKMIPIQPIGAANVSAATTSPTPVGQIEPVVAPPSPTAANTELPPPPPRVLVAGKIQPVVSPLQPAPVAEKIAPVVEPLASTAVNVPTATTTPIAPTKPNLAKVQPTIAPTQTSSSVGIQPTIEVSQSVAKLQPVVTAPSFMTRTASLIGTQPSIAPRSNDRSEQPPATTTPQPSTTPQTPAAITEPATTPASKAVTPTKTVETKSVTTPEPLVGITEPVTTPTPKVVDTQSQIVPTTQPTQAVNSPTPMAPTKPNNIVNTKPQSALPKPSASTGTQFIVTEDVVESMPNKPSNIVRIQPKLAPPFSAPTVARFTVAEDAFELMPIQVDNTGNIQPEIAPVSTP